MGGSQEESEFFNESKHDAYNKTWHTLVLHCPHMGLHVGNPEFEISLL
jgi:hypothetical protein